MRRFAFFLISGIIISNFSYGQVKTMSTTAGGSGDPTNYIRTDLIPASPNAASIGRYGEIPVNQSTGSANVNILLFKVTGTDLSLPILN